MKNSTISVSVDIDLDKIISDIDSSDLLDELQRRSKQKEFSVDDNLEFCTTPFEVKKHLIKLFNLQKWATKEQIKAEIDI